MKLLSTILFYLALSSPSTYCHAFTAEQQKAHEESVEDELSLTAELRFIVAKLQGGDKRLLRNHAMKHTHETKSEEGTCEKLNHALSILVDEVSYTTDDSKFLICEMATLCVTDHTNYRNVFSAVEGIHQVVLDLVASPNPKISAKAAHLVYISTFANQVNHQTYFENGAVNVLSKVVKARRAKPIQRMFALAALQNMAASYCKTPEGEVGSCSWGWKLEDEHIAILGNDQVIVSDGGAVRQALLEDTELSKVLNTWICHGPVEGDSSEDNVFPGYNGMSTGRDDDNSAIVPWAATGLLKNLALEPAAKPMVERSIACLCNMSHSPDWLERSKAEDCLHNVRREGDPCWYAQSDDSDLSCVDRNFLDTAYNTCEDYEEAIEEDCDAHKDIFTDMTARRACCTCGGGFSLIRYDEL